MDEKLQRLLAERNSWSYRLSLPKIPSLFIDKHLRTIANSPGTTTNDTMGEQENPHGA
jgi:hypothetical protein